MREKQSIQQNKVLGKSVGAIMLFLGITTALAFGANVKFLSFHKSEKQVAKPGDSTRFKNWPRQSWDKPRKKAFDLKEPDIIKTTYELDSSGKFYTKKQSIGNTPVGTPETISLEDYSKIKDEEQNKNYFKQRAKAQNFVRSSGGTIPPLFIPGKTFQDFFGNGKVEIKPTGSAELTFGGIYNLIRNPILNSRQQRNAQFDFKQKIQLNVAGSIGDKFKINTNYNTEALFDFENQMKLNWDGKEDGILKKIEVGNVSMPLNGTLIPGSQSLFGAKVKFQFGRLTSTVLFSQQKSRASEVTVQGGAQITPFDIQCDQYEQNKHYFLSQYFRDHYEAFLDRPPLVQSPVRVTRVEVWVTNRTSAVDNARDIMGFMDLGEDAAHIYNKQITATPAKVFPENIANDLYKTLTNNVNFRSTFKSVNELQQNTQTNKMKQIDDYQLINFARQLNPNEFTFHTQLGYISLNQTLNNDEVLAVAFEYEIGGQPYQVGEFSRQVPTDRQSPNVLFLKLLKPISIRPDLPNWKLMMKNIYSVGSYQIQKQDFKLNVWYADDPSNADMIYLPAKDEPKLQGLPLVRVLNIDRVNSNLEAQPDGQFDWIEGITISPQQGRIIFPVLEPFGKFLRSKFKDPNGANANYYAFDELYDSTRWAAQQKATKNKFFIRGSFKGSASNEIQLSCFNAPKGSVKVTSNGTPLIEGNDYLVDYSTGRVTIINTGILAQGAAIKASCENTATFTTQQRTLMGTRLDFKVSEDFIIGGTLLNLRERPIIPKVSIGDEPLNNTIVGLDATYKSNWRGLTKAIDRLPFLSTKEMSNFLFTGEFAKIIPGVAPAIKKTLDKSGVSFVDDFEASEIPTDLRLGNYWQLASTPQGQADLFPDGNNRYNIGFRDHAARMSWYILDPLFYTNNNLTPPHLKNDPGQLSNHYVRQVVVNEVFKNKQIQQGVPQTQNTFDISYFPNQRGPYNFNATDINSDGTFKSPKSNWAGIMRKIDQNDFEAANIDYIELWMMDPFLNGHNPQPNNSGQLYLHLGNVSEDMLSDSRKSFENGLTTNTQPNLRMDTTVWGNVPAIPAINNAFDNDPNSRLQQDVGLDGLSDANERDFYKKKYLDSLANNFGTNSKAYIDALNDPASDNYHFYRGSDFDSAKTSILARYKYFNGPDGNSPSPNAPPPHQPKETYPVANQPNPNDEDINKDFTLNEIEEYYQYRIDLSKSKLIVGQNYVTDSVRSGPKLEKPCNCPDDTVTWYQLKVPVRSYERRIGSIPDFKSIRFMRMIMRGFTDSVVLRFANMQLIRAEWRKYLVSLATPGSVNPIDPNDNTSFVVSTVNVEENNQRQPVPYVLPPGIFRQLDVSQPNPIQQNEQSLSLRVCGLKDGDARAVFKNVKLDIRNYKTLKMFVHAEALAGEILKDKDLSVFVRLGTDFTNNYYEYEIPLKLTNWGQTNENDIWRADNELNIDIAAFYDLKVLRLKQGGTNTYFENYTPDGKRLAVNGIPDMSNIRVILIGVRNPKQFDNPADDGLSKCGEIWVNELRVSGFENPGGWAATARSVIKLADIGTLNMAGNITTVGYGGIDKKLNDRARNLTTNFDLNTMLELGKFFPAKSGVSIPFYYGYNQTLVRPHFYPLNPDIPMSSVLNVTPADERANIKYNADDLTIKKGWNVSNVHKNLTGSKKKKFYSIENFNLSYAFNEFFQRNQLIQYNKIKLYNFKLNYSFQTQAKPVEPFKKHFKSKYLQLIRDFNFYYKPQSINIITNTDRRYGEMVNRVNDNLNNTRIDTLYDKNFTTSRQFDVKWDLTKALKFDYNAITNARIDEPAGAVFRYSGEGHDSIIKNIKRLGRITQFNQMGNLSYTLPFNKFPLTNFISMTARVSVNYSWTQGPPGLQDTIGNTIANSKNNSLTGQFNMQQLYNKIKFLERIASGKKQTPPPPPPKVKPKVPNKVPKKKATDEDTSKVDETPTPNSKNPLLSLAEHTARLVMMVKTINFTYTENRGTTLPGFLPKPKYFGQNFDMMAPGWDFITGSQDSMLKYDAAKNGWLAAGSGVNNPNTRTLNKQFNMQATVEPFNDFRIQLTFQRSMTTSYQSFFNYEPSTNGYSNFAPLENGTFSMTYNIIRTAFSKSTPINSDVFEKMRDQRFTIASQLQSTDDRSKGKGVDVLTGYPMGYSPLQHDVVIHSFLSAYSGKNPINYKAELFPKIPSASWRVTWNGLSKIPAIKKIIPNLSLSHAYASTYSVGGFGSSLGYSVDSALSSRGVGATYTLEPRLALQNVTIAERFSPLIGVDMTFTNSFTFKFELKKERMLSLVPVNPQLQEMKNREIVIGAGFRKKGLTIRWIKFRGNSLYLPNDASFRFDFSIRDNWTTIRKFDGVSVPTAGMKIISIKPTIDYQASDKVLIRLYYDQRISKPYTTSSYPTTNVQFGVTARYTLQ
ncbi:MAG: cell surface protein SprA [Bacteroidota bacterium]|nr:cell surface protein SprA [Bacteroidota bacterium]